MRREREMIVTQNHGQCEQYEQLWPCGLGFEFIVKEINMDMKYRLGLDKQQRHAESRSQCRPLALLGNISEGRLRIGPNSNHLWANRPIVVTLLSQRTNKASFDTEPSALWAVSWVLHYRSVLFKCCINKHNIPLRVDRVVEVAEIRLLVGSDFFLCKISKIRTLVWHQHFQGSESVGLS